MNFKRKTLIRRIDLDFQKINIEIILTSEFVRMTAATQILSAHYKIIHLPYNGQIRFVLLQKFVEIQKFELFLYLDFLKVCNSVLFFCTGLSKTEME